MITRNSVEGAYPVTTLDRVVNFLDSKRRPVTESNRKTGPYPYYGANGIQGNIDGYIFDEPLVLLAEDGGHFDDPERGIAYRISGKTWVNNHAHVLQPKPGIDLAFLCRVLENYDVKPFVTGTTRGKLTKGGASGIPIPLPPLPEQRRIAAILDQADALRAKRREALAQLDSLTQSIFIEMFGGANEYPISSLAELCELITDGTHQTPEYADEGVIFLSAKNVTSGYVDWERIKFIPESLHLELHRRLSPRVNDILLAKNGTTGVAAIVDRDCTFDIYVSLALLRAKQGVLPAFLLGAINSPICKQQFNDSLKGVGVPNLHLKEIRATQIPHPPLSLQNEFLGRITTLEKLKVSQRSSLVELDALFTALQHRAFQGEL